MQGGDPRVREPEEGCMTDEDDIAKIANRLSAETTLAAQRIAELEADNAELTEELKEQSGSWAATIGVVVLVALCAFTLGWRLGSTGQFDAGYRMGQSEGDSCPG